MNRTIATILYILLPLLALTSCGGAKLKTADEQMARGEYFDASKTYRKVYNKLKPREQRAERAEVAYKMAECHRQLGQDARAAAAYQNALRYGYPDSTILLRLAQAQHGQGQYALAVKSYEEYLRGDKGVEILMRDAYGRIQGRYEDGAYDMAPKSGRNLTLSLDIKLQQYAESLMVNKIGAVVAIEPKTGEILCMVSSPTYDPTLLVGRERGKNYQKLASPDNEDHPLFDRALMGTYPPGSTFKPGQALILLQEGIITPDTPYPCYHGYINGGLKVGCHGHYSPIPVKPALQTSCNAFFCWGLKNMVDRRSKYGSSANAFEVWKNYLVQLGYGYRLGVDLPSESRGFIPNAKFYDKVYGESHWSANTIISVSIGQGEVLATPLQMANVCATIANRGHFITPHVVKAIEDTVMPVELLEPRRPEIDRKWFELVAEGMRMAVTGGACRTANLPDIEVCGKTGTAQNPHGKDHSAFIGFAPYDDPQIAVAVYVENGGLGAMFGVPIGSLVLEKYLKGEISPSRKYLEDNMLNSNTKQFRAIKSKPRG